MADEQKNYADWIDIPNGNGSTQRTWFRDADSVAMMLSVIDSIEMDETSGDITIEYDDGTEDEEES